MDISTLDKVKKAFDDQKAKEYSDLIDWFKDITDNDTCEHMHFFKEEADELSLLLLKYDSVATLIFGGYKDPLERVYDIYHLYHYHVLDDGDIYINPLYIESQNIKNQLSNHDYASVEHSELFSKYLKLSHGPMFIYGQDIGPREDRRRLKDLLMVARTEAKTVEAKKIVEEKFVLECPFDRDNKDFKVKIKLKKPISGNGCLWKAQTIVHYSFDIGTKAEVSSSAVPWAPDIVIPYMNDRVGYYFDSAEDFLEHVEIDNE